MSGDSDFPSPQEMKEWLQRETDDINRAAQLRIKDAASLVDAYSAGNINAEQAGDRVQSYGKRWGDVLPGVLRSEGLTDDEILSRMDQAREKQSRSQEKRQRG